MTFEQLVGDINDKLRLQFEKFHCINGFMHYQGWASLIRINAFKADGSSVVPWQTEPGLASLLAQYIEQVPDCGGVMIMIDLLKDQFIYNDLFRTALQQAAEQQKMQEVTETKQLEYEKHQKRKALEQKTEKFGVGLAEKVAAALLHDRVAYGHRDYCGMGLEYREGLYKYGEVHDGYFITPTLQWSTKEEFVAWLAEQSDASLARFEEKESYWGNQTITRVRLVSLINRTAKR